MKVAEGHVHSSQGKYPAIALDDSPVICRLKRYILRFKFALSLHFDFPEVTKGKVLSTND